MDPRLEAICSVHGVFLRSEAAALGYHDRAIARLIRDGTWHRVRRGAYVFGETWRNAERETKYCLFALATVRQSQTDVVPSHASAVALHRGPLWGLDLSHSHLTRLDGRTGRKEAGVEQHRGLIEPGDIVEVDGRQVMSPTRCALEVTSMASVEASLCVLDDFLHRGLTTPEALRERYRTMSLWPGTLRTDVALRLADGRRESVGESRMFFVCWRGHLPWPAPQLEVYDENGILIGRVDFAWPEHGVFLEFDGLQKYLRFRREGESIEDAILREKRREEQICEITGWRCIRVVWADLERPEILAGRIRKMLTGEVLPR